MVGFFLPLYSVNLLCFEFSSINLTKSDSEDHIVQEFKDVETICRVAAYSEWKILYVLCKDKNGLLRKDTVRAVYDGSLFEHMEKEHESAKKKA